MSRPIGVTGIAVLLLGWSLLTVMRAMTLPGASRRNGLLICSLVLALLAFAAAEALWTLRRNAFLMFLLWGISAMFATVLIRLSAPSHVRATQIFSSIVSAGLVYAFAAIYLRRVL